ncbi:MAG: hypothetical protein R3244_11460 [Thermoanaerobaculia bacterium]|nr:hypothetical protein [Thermoanaerobaculia bacterium]
MSAWRRALWERRWWWLPGAVLIVVSLAALGWYQLAYSGFTRSVDQRLEARTSELERLERLVRQRRVDRRQVRYNRRELRKFYRKRLGRPSKRLTIVIGEVRSLARRAGLEPSAIDYPREPIGELGLVERSFSFSVQGSYAELRRFINLLEVTPTFLTLEAVQLTGREGGSELRIGLELSTLFTAEGRTASPESAS